MSQAGRSGKQARLQREECLCLTRRCRTSTDEHKQQMSEINQAPLKTQVI